MTFSSLLVEGAANGSVGWVWSAPDTGE